MLRKDGTFTFEQGTEQNQLHADLRRLDWWYPILDKREIKRKLNDGKNLKLKRLWEQVKKEGITISQVALIGGWDSTMRTDVYFIASKEDVEALVPLVEAGLSTGKLTMEERLKLINDSQRGMLDPEKI